MDDAFLGYMVEELEKNSKKKSSSGLSVEDNNRIIEAIRDRMCEGATLEDLYEEFDFVNEDSITEVWNFWSNL